MKKVLAMMFVCMFVVAMVCPAYATMDKLTGGLETIVKSPLQIVDNTKAEYEAAEFKPFGLVGGLLKGAAYMVKDVILGVVDVVTFPVE